MNKSRENNLSLIIHQGKKNPKMEFNSEKRMHHFFLAASGKREYVTRIYQAENLMHADGKFIPITIFEN